MHVVQIPSAVGDRGVVADTEFNGDKCHSASGTRTSAVSASRMVHAHRLDQESLGRDRQRWLLDLC